MKYLIILSMLFSGCATVSEYQKGCRDGIEAVAKNSLERDRNAFCYALEKVRHEETKDQGRPGGL